MDVYVKNLERCHCPKCGARLDISELAPFSRFTCPRCEHRNFVPAMFGHFLLQEQLGEGVMSVVFRAYDETLKRYIAIKILNKVLSRNRELVEAFKREANSAAALNHPNVVKVYEFGEINSQPYMIMELIQGQHLNDIAKDEPLSESRIVDIGIGVAQGLSETYEAGLVHGEVMPRNIMIDDEGNPKISDFGLARLANRDQSQDDNTWSSPYYMPPERILGKAEDHRGDIYSLGTTLFFLFCGRLPFFDVEDQVVRDAKVQNAAPRIQDYNQNVKESTAELVDRMLATRPEDRPATFAELIQELQRIRNHLEEEETVVNALASGDAAEVDPASRAELDPVTDREHAPDERRKSNPYIVVGGLTALLVGAVYYAILQFSSGEDPQTKDPLENPAAVSAVPPAPPPDANPAEDPEEEAIPAFDEVPNLALWLKADLGVITHGRLAIGWEDQSGHDRHFKQGRRVLCPDYLPATESRSASLLFDNKMLTGPGILSPGQACTLFAVIRDLNSEVDASAHPLHSIMQDHRARVGLHTDGQGTHHIGYTLGAEAFEANASLNGDAHAKILVELILRPVDSEGLTLKPELFCNGRRLHAQPRPPSRVSVDIDAQSAFSLGGLPGQEAFFTGYISEILVYDRGLSHREQESVTRYLSEKYPLKKVLGKPAK